MLVGRYRPTTVGLVIAVGIILAGGLSGCRRPERQGTLWWFTWTPAEEYALNQRLAAQFEREHPGVKVRLTNDPSQQAMQKLQVTLSAGAAPDLMSIHGAFFVPFATAGALLDITERAEQDAEFKLSDFYPGLLDLCRVEGRLYSIPRYASVYSMFYNKTLFDRAGVPYPGSGPSWTWDDFRSTAKALTKDENADGVPEQYGCAIDFWGARIYPWVWQNGGQVISPDKKRAMLSSPATQEALQFLVDLKAKDKVAPQSVEDERRGSKELFKMGRVAMYMSGPWDVQEFERMPDLVWDVAPLPQKKQKASLLGTENYAIGAKTKMPDQAWALLKFLLSPEVQKTVAEEIGKMPSRISVAEGPFLAQKVGYNRRVFVEALAYGKMPPNIPGWNEVLDIMQRALDAIWQGKASVSEATKQADREINEVLLRWQTQKNGQAGRGSQK